MLRFLDPHSLKQTYRDPVALVILAVDLIPVIAVLTLGWGATALVFLYWLENLVIGAVALAKMIAASVRESLFGLFGILLIGPFFVVHYGMFCFGHGFIIAALASSVGSRASAEGDVDFSSGPLELIDYALSTGAYMPTFLLVIVCVQVILFIQDFLLRGEYQKTTTEEQMMAPYGRIIVLHIGIFAGAFGTLAIGEPMWGILGLIILRTLWGMFLTARRRVRLDDALQQKS